MMFYFWLLMKIAAIIFVGGVIGGWLAGIVGVALERRGADPAIRRLAANAMQPIALIIAAVAAAQYLGIDLTAVVAILGAGALAVGLALKSTLSNVASGGILLTTRPISEGEFVQIAGQQGTVVEQGLYTTTVKTVDGVITTVPNDLVLSAPVHNFTRNGTRRLNLTFVLTAHSDLAAAAAAISKVLTEDPRVLADPAPAVVTGELTPQGVQIIGRAWVANADYGNAKSDLTRAAIEAVRSADVTLSTLPKLVQEG